VLKQISPAGGREKAGRAWPRTARATQETRPGRKGAARTRARKPPLAGHGLFRAETRALDARAILKDQRTSGAVVGGKQRGHDIFAGDAHSRQAARRVR
jgi:hypothetical protein